MIITCKACGHKLEASKFDYVLCDNCSSANLISDKPAEEDNKDYFNTIFSDAALKESKLRKKLFLFFGMMFKAINYRSQRTFNESVKSIYKEVIKAHKCLEIGFGGGDELLRFIQGGADIYGLDLSDAAVKNFKEKYPAHQDRVFSGSKVNDTFNLIYCNALFEHLDEPKKFLETAHSMLNSKGKLILRIPYIRECNDLENVRDINLWAPCHRVLYSLRGIRELMVNNLFKLLKYTEYDYYGYRVMNQMLQNSFDSIMYYRNPYLRIPEIKSHYHYSKILFKSLYGSSNSGELVLFLEKC